MARAVLSFSSSCQDKTAWQSNSAEEDLFCLTAQGTAHHMRNSRGFGHRASTVRKQREMNSRCCSAGFLQFRQCRISWVSQALRFSTSVKTIKAVPHKHDRLPVILDSTKLTVNTDHHEEESICKERKRFFFLKEDQGTQR